MCGVAAVKSITVHVINVFIIHLAGYAPCTFSQFTPNFIKWFCHDAAWVA